MSYDQLIAQLRVEYISLAAHSQNLLRDPPDMGLAEFINPWSADDLEQARTQAKEWLAGTPWVADSSRRG
jgi:hypothetical protein